jgi:hypothetical protein
VLLQWLPPPLLLLLQLGALLLLLPGQLKGPHRSLQAVPLMLMMQRQLQAPPAQQPVLSAVLPVLLLQRHSESALLLLQRATRLLLPQLQQHTRFHLAQRPPVQLPPHLLLPLHLLLLQHQLLLVPLLRLPLQLPGCHAALHRTAGTPR